MGKQLAQSGSSPLRAPLPRSPPWASRPLWLGFGVVFVLLTRSAVFFSSHPDPSFSSSSSSSSPLPSALSTPFPGNGSSSGENGQEVQELGTRGGDGNRTNSSGNSMAFADKGIVSEEGEHPLGTAGADEGGDYGEGEGGGSEGKGGEGAEEAEGEEGEGEEEEVVEGDSSTTAAAEKDGLRLSREFLASGGRVGTAERPGLHAQQQQQQAGGSLLSRLRLGGGGTSSEKREKRHTAEWATPYAEEHKISVKDEPLCQGIIPPSFYEQRNLPIQTLADLKRPGQRVLVFVARFGLGNTLRGYVSAFVYAMLAGRRLVRFHGGEHAKVYDLLCKGFDCGFDSVHWDRPGPGGANPGARCPGGQKKGKKVCDQGDPQMLWREFGKLRPFHIMPNKLKSTGIAKSLSYSYPLVVVKVANHFDFWATNRTLRTCVYAAFGCSSLWCVHSRAIHALLGQGPSKALEEVVSEVVERREYKPDVDVLSADAAVMLSPGAAPAAAAADADADADADGDGPLGLLAGANSSGGDGDDRVGGSSGDDRVGGSSGDEESSGGSDSTHNSDSDSDIDNDSNSGSDRSADGSSNSAAAESSSRRSGDSDRDAGSDSADEGESKNVSTAGQVLIGNSSSSSSSTSVAESADSSVADEEAEEVGERRQQRRRLLVKGEQQQALAAGASELQESEQQQQQQQQQQQPAQPAHHAQLGVDVMFDVAVHIRTRTEAVEHSHTCKHNAACRAKFLASAQKRERKYMSQQLWSCLRNIMAKQREIAKKRRAAGGADHPHNSGGFLRRYSKWGRNEGSNDEFRIFLATDNEAMRDDFVARLATMGTVYFSTGRVVHTSKSAGGLPTLAEWYLLAKTHLLLEAEMYVSTFAYFSGLLGNGTLASMAIKDANSCSLKAAHQAPARIHLT